MHAHQNSFVQDTILATVILVGVYALRSGIQLHSLLIPSYPLRAGIVVLKGLFDFTESMYPLVFIAYFFVLGLVGTAATYVVHRWVSDDQTTNWRLGVASALGVVGLHWVLFTVVFYDITHIDTEPIMITGISGLILLGAASWLAGGAARLNHLD